MSRKVVTTQMTASEIASLADRLEARGQSILFKDQPEQQRDINAAARLLHELARERGKVEAA